ncbi:MAG TPA: ABC transporter substrate-binding protein [Burkholderiaceae bacterium]|nr:ABC transporter substrate-binding protein [Burkholderiaceae bacterium]
MSISRRDLLKLAGAAGAATVVPGISRAASAEKKDVIIAVGGQALIYYLPLSIARDLHYFKDEGLNVKVMDFAGGSKALQAVVGGSADVVSGAFEHTIFLQVKGQMYRTFAQQGRAPMMVLGVSTKTMPNYKSPADLKGKKIGVTAPGSSTNMMVSFFLAKHGLKANDVSYIGVGAGQGAITALRTGQIDAICNVDPVISTLVHAKELKVIADTRTLKDTRDIFGGDMPAGCLYASQKFIDENPKTTQLLANAIVRADRWIQENSIDKIAATVPKQYLLGDPDLYKLALKANMQALSPDGLVPAGGPETALKALAAYVPHFQADKIDISKVWTNAYALKADKKYPHA